MVGPSPVSIRLGPRFGDHQGGNQLPALFLDRDGVINEDVNYVGDPREVRVFAATARAIRHANARGVPVVVVSNQSGVGRQMFGWPEVIAVDDEVTRQLARHGAAVDLTLYAGSAPDGPAAALAFRKPLPGMFDLACRLLPLDRLRSLMVGDKASDMAAAKAAGLGAAIFVGGGTVVAGGGGPLRRLHAASLDDASREIVRAVDAMATGL